MIGTQDRMRRLAFAKYLIEMGTINADNVLPYSAMSILNFHDAIEFLFDLILEDNGSSANNFNFMACFDEMNRILKENGKDQSSFRGSLEKLKDRRVVLKHKGSFPSQNDISEAKYTTINLFKEFCLKFYNLNYEDIDLVELLEDSRTKDCLLKIRNCEDNNVIADNFALAFAYLLKDFENSKIINVYESPYQFTKNMSLGSTDGLSDEFDFLKDFMDTTNQNIESLEYNLKIIALGIDYNKYAKFNFLIPADIRWAMNNDDPMILFRYKPVKLNDNQIEFCKNFIIESALKLQQFDFEIPDDFALTNSMNVPLTNFFKMD